MNILNIKILFIFLVASIGNIQPSNALSEIDKEKRFAQSGNSDICETQFIMMILQQ